MSHLNEPIREDLPGMYPSLTGKNILDTINEDIKKIYPSLKVEFEAEKTRLEKISKNVDPKNVDAMKDILNRAFSPSPGVKIDSTTSNLDSDLGKGGDAFMRSILQKINYFENCDDALLGPFGHLNIVSKQIPYMDLLFFGDVFIKNLGIEEDLGGQYTPMNPVIDSLLTAVESCEAIIIGKIKDKSIYIFYDSGTQKRDLETVSNHQPVISQNLITFLSDLKKLSYTNMQMLGEKIIAGINKGKYQIKNGEKYDRNVFCFELLGILEDLALKEKVTLMKESEKTQIINSYLKG